MNGKIKKAIAALAVCLSVNSLMAETGEVVGWRTDGTGKYPEAKIVKEWSETKNVVWKTAMPEWGNATPVIVDGKIYVGAERQWLICVDEKTGKILWQKSKDAFDSLPENEKNQIKKFQDARNKLNRSKRRLKRAKDKEAAQAAIDKAQEYLTSLDPDGDIAKKVAGFKLDRTHDVNGYSSPTSVSDSKYIYVSFGTGIVTCYDLDGNQVWETKAGKAGHGWGHSASTVLVDDKLILHYAREVVALKKSDGSQLWKASSKSSWGTPIAFNLGKEKGIVTTGGDIIRVRDGKVIASGVVQLPWSTAVVEDGVLYAFDERGATALKLPAAADDTITPEVLWSVPVKRDRYYSSPVVYKGLIYNTTRNSQLTVLDIKDGATVYTQKLDFEGRRTTVYPSPVLVGDKLIISADNGSMITIEPGREYKEITRTKIEPFRACPVISNNRMFVRGLKNLWCFGAN